MGVTARAPTRADVAREAGVSTAVVSYVVNEGPRRVAPETAARVRAAVENLRYRPNGNARALRRGSTDMIGLVVPDIENPFFAGLARAAEVAAAARGLMLLVGNSDARKTTEQRLVDEMADRHVDGLLLFTVHSPSELAALPDPGRPTVVVGGFAAYPGYRAVGSAARTGSAELVEHLLTVHGHTSVVLVMGEVSQVGIDPRESGWTDAFRAHSLPPGPIVRCGFGRRSGYETMREILTWRARPTALFLTSDQQAVGALRAVHEAGLSCPGDLAVVCFDGTQESEFCWPPLTVARQPVRALAEAALTAVLDPTTSPGFTELATELVVRTSCGCPAPA